MGSLEERLFTACSKGDLASVKHYLERGANMNTLCSDGRTPFGRAAQMGNTEILKVFLDNCNVGGKNKPVSTSSNQYSHQKSSYSPSQTEDRSNLGYFVFVHNDQSTLASPEKTSSDRNLNNSMEDLYFGDFCDETDSVCTMFSVSQETSFDFDSFNEPFMQDDPMFSSSDWLSEADYIFNEEVLTPDGMDNLEWDMEVQEDKDLVLEEDDPWSALYLWYAGILSQMSALLEEKPPPNDIDREDYYGRRALHYAAVEGHIEAVKLLLNAGCKVNMGDSDNLTPLHMAAARPVPEVVDVLIHSGANVHHKTTEKISPLHVCASRGLLNNARLLVAAGAHLDPLDCSDRTPLFMAVLRGHQEVVSFLLQSGAKVNIEEIHGYTPLYEAVRRTCRQKNTGIVRLLLNAGAKITQSHHLLHYAVLHRHRDVAEMLIKAGSIINLRDETGDTPLIVAAKTQQPDLARLLIAHGASVNCASYVTGNTALHESVENLRGNPEQFQEMLTLLQQHDADLDAVSESGYTALDLAIARKLDDAAAALIRRGASVNRTQHRDYFLDSFPCLLFRENRFLVELFVHAGHQLQGYTLPTFPGPVTELELWLAQVKSNPMRLCDLCRISIRRQFKFKIFEQVDSLILPPMIKRYLKLEDIE